MDLKLSGKTAIVTGASKGIGRAIAERLAQEGCRVVLAARGADLLDQAAAAIVADGGEAVAFPADVTSADAIKALVEAAIRRFGGVDILVNNAGGGTEPYRFEDITDDDWRAGWELNFLSAVRASRAVLPLMQARKWGRIINISSAASVQPEASYAHYSAAKAALNNFGKTLSKHAGRDGVMVNTIVVGLVKSEQFEEDVMKRRRGARSHARGSRDRLRPQTAARKCARQGRRDGRSG